VLLAATLIAGCSPPGERVGVATDSILFGDPSGPDEDYVVQVRATDEMRIERGCTGTLVAPNLVITARHCISNFVDEPFGCTSGGELSPSSTGGQTG